MRKLLMILILVFCSSQLYAANCTISSPTVKSWLYEGCYKYEIYRVESGKSCKSKYGCLDVRGQYGDVQSLNIIKKRNRFIAVAGDAASAPSFCGDLKIGRIHIPNQSLEDEDGPSKIWNFHVWVEFFDKWEGEMGFHMLDDFQGETCFMRAKYNCER